MDVGIAPAPAGSLRLGTGSPARGARAGRAGPAASRRRPALGHHTGRSRPGCIRACASSGLRRAGRSRTAAARRIGPLGLGPARKRAASGIEAARATERLRLRLGTLDGHARDRSGRAAALERLAKTLAAHDPERVLERGYAVVEDTEGDVITGADDARRAGAVRIRFSDDEVDAEVTT